MEAAQSSLLNLKCAAGQEVEDLILNIFDGLS